jgi:hypothetical protein
MRSMQRGLKTLAATCIGFGIFSAASATPLRLDFSVNNVGGGIYHYDFTLSVDNHDNTYAAGNGWGWLIFGDQSNAPTNLTNFVMDAGVYPVGPWTDITSSGGGHNGPTFLPLHTGAPDFLGVAWIPTGIGASIHWAGTSTANLGDGQLLFSTLTYNVGGAVAADFEPGHLTAVPEPATLAALTIGIAALTRRRRAR